MFQNTRLYRFYEQIKQEMFKVVWPDKKDLIIMTAMVVSAIAVFSVIVLLIDYGMHRLLHLLLVIGK